METDPDEIYIEASDDEEEPYFVHEFRESMEKGLRVTARRIVEYLHLVKNDGEVPENNYRSYITSLFKGRVPNSFIERTVVGEHLPKTIVEAQGQIILFLEIRSFGRDETEFNSHEILMIENLFSVLGTAVSTDTAYYAEFCKDIYTIYRQDIPWTIYQIFFIIDRIPPKEFCEVLKQKCHHFKLHLKKKYFPSIPENDLLLENDMESPFQLLKKKKILENGLLKGPLQDRLEQIDMKCTQKEKIRIRENQKEIILFLKPTPQNHHPPSDPQHPQSLALPEENHTIPF